MRELLYKRLPKIWKEQDKERIVERFLNVFDNGFDSVNDSIRKLIKIRSIDEVPDDILRLVAPLVGHEWIESRGVKWNRDRIRHSIYLHSIKGSYKSIKRAVKDSGGRFARVRDNVSSLVIVGKQGRLGCTDAVIMDDWFWHDGSYVLETDYKTNKEDLGYFLERVLPEGTLWWTDFFRQIPATLGADARLIRTTNRKVANILDGAIGYGALGKGLQISFESNLHIRRTYIEANWKLVKKFTGIGFSEIGTALAIPPKHSGWIKHDFTLAGLKTITNIHDDKIIGKNLSISYESGEVHFRKKD